MYNKEREMKKFVITAYNKQGPYSVTSRGTVKGMDDACRELLRDPSIVRYTVEEVELD